MTIKELRKYRKELSITQQTMADKCNMHRSRYNMMESGKYRPLDMDEKLSVIEEALGKKLDQRIKEHKEEIKNYELMIKDIFQ